MIPSLVFGPTGVETITMTASSTAAGITSSALTNVAGKPAIWAEVTAMDYPILYAFGTDPVTATFGHILGEDQTMILSCPGDIKNFKFCSKVLTSNATVIITPKF